MKKYFHNSGAENWYFYHFSSFFAEKKEVLWRHLWIHLDKVLKYYHTHILINLHLNENEMLEHRCNLDLQNRSFINNQQRLFRLMCKHMTNELMK